MVDEGGNFVDCNGSAGTCHTFWTTIRIEENITGLFRVVFEDRLIENCTWDGSPCGGWKHWIDYGPESITARHTFRGSIFAIIGALTIIAGVLVSVLLRIRSRAKDSDPMQATT